MIYVILICLVTHCAFYIFIFSRLALYQGRKKSKKGNPKDASIVICYRNEEHNVVNTLPSILKQKVNELILVDDHSSDRTLEMLKRDASKSVKILSIGNDSNGKKHALSRGIHSSKNDIILLTDADCNPATELWSSHMCADDSPFVLGYGPMNRVSGTVATFARFETYMTALQYFSYALAGMPYMGVGRNMKIDRQILLDKEHLIKGSNLASGDDDLTINALANEANIGICIEPDSFMYSDPKTTLRSFLNQKTRHISTSIYYRPIHQVLLGLYSGSQILFFLAFIFSLITGTIPLKIALLLLLVKWTIQQGINYPVMKKLKEEDLFWKFPILDVLFFVYLLVMPFYFFINKNNSRWS